MFEIKETKDLQKHLQVILSKMGMDEAMSHITPTFRREERTVYSSTLISTSP